MKRNITKIMLIGLAAALVLSLGACSKYKGFKKDKSGFYYKFYGDIHDTADQPETGDYVGLLMSLRAGDSLLIPMMPQEMVMDSLYEGDMYAALRTMHVGDSATFIFDGPKFFKEMIDPNREYEFGEDPIYLDVKIYGLLKKAEFEKLKAEYEAQLAERRDQEKTEIEEYLQKNPGLKQNDLGYYLKSVKKGTGEKVEPLQTVKVHYTGRFVDGTVFDSSEDRDPLEFTVGAGRVIPGWDAVVSSMRVGDKVTVLFPSSLAYGDGSTTGGAMPPYSPLVFDIELLEIVE